MLFPSTPTSKPSLQLVPLERHGYVHGFPGIPAGPNRPQASIKGIVKVSVGPKGPVLAESVEINLVREEVTPLQGNRARQTVRRQRIGSVILWQPESLTDDFEAISDRNLKFAFTLPEGIAPSTNLDYGYGRGGIQYKLEASMTTPNKKMRIFPRKQKKKEIRASANISIQRYDLLPAWPKYCQIQSGIKAVGGIDLIIRRDRSCYGPGDLISVTAAATPSPKFRVASLSFEMVLTERIWAFDQAQATASREVAKTGIIRSKFHPREKLHMAELAFSLPSDHYNPTLNVDNCVNVEHILSVEVTLMINLVGGPVIYYGIPEIRLPILISSVPRSDSQKVIKHIGHVHSLCGPARRKANVQEPSNTRTKWQPDVFDEPQDTSADSNRHIPPRNSTNNPEVSDGVSHTDSDDITSMKTGDTAARDQQRVSEERNVAHDISAPGNCDLNRKDKRTDASGADQDLTTLRGKMGSFHGGHDFVFNNPLMVFMNSDHDREASTKDYGLEKDSTKVCIEGDMDSDTSSDRPVK